MAAAAEIKASVILFSLFCFSYRCLSLIILCSTYSQDYTQESVDSSNSTYDLFAKRKTPYTSKCKI